METKLSMANRYLEESFNKEKEQQELMLQLQIQLNKLQNNDNTLKRDNDKQSTTNNDGLNHKPPISNQSNNSKYRAKTAPNGYLEENQVVYYLY